MNVRVCGVAVLLCALGCSENPVIMEANVAPLAEAGDNRCFLYPGVPIAVTLDGTESTDSDGTIRAYRWLSATRPPGGGAGRYVPPGETMEWPADTSSPIVRLPEGVWVFSLQVTDDDVSTSLQDTVTITVSTTPPPPVGGAGAMMMCIPGTPAPS